MTKKEKIVFIINELQKLYPEIPIPLNHQDPYTLLIAVLMSAQSTDIRVNKITPLLFERANNPYDMVKLSIDQIREIIKPVGLSPMKSKGIYELSHILIDKHNGEVPKSFEELEELPSVGHKTASVVMSQAFGVPAFPVDTHIHRLMYRWGLSNGKNVTQTEKDAKRIFPQEKWNDLHLQIIWYGRQYSPARGFQSCVEHVLHFGIEQEAELIDSVVVDWFDDYRQVIVNVPPNQVISINKSNAQPYIVDNSSDSMSLYSTLPASVYGIDFKHIENDYDDFVKESLLLLPYQPLLSKPF